MNRVWILIALGLAVLISACSGDAESQVTFTGTIRTGAQLGEVKNYCGEGLYLVAEEGTYLTGQTTMLLLRTSNGGDESVMLSDQQYVGKRVEVIGKYPAQEVFCEALICACEDYILVTQINILSP